MQPLTSQRGIDVLIEIDTPGHTASISYSHPEYIACYDASPWEKYSHEPPAGQLRYADKNVTAFTAEVFRQTAKLATSRYLSSGGDEINEKCMVGRLPSIHAPWLRASLKAVA
jgi:hexosaminidase